MAQPAAKVVCITSDGVRIDVEVEAMKQSHVFTDMWKDLDMEGDGDFPAEFPVRLVEARVMRRVIQWCQEHKGKFQRRAKNCCSQTQKS